MTLHLDGTFETWISGWNAFQVRHLKPTAGPAIIVVALHITLLTVLFAPLLHTILEDHNPPLLTSSNELTRYAEISTGLTVTETSANFLTDVRSVMGPTPPRAAWQRGSPILVKPPPWTPLRPFILERELDNYPDRVFVRQLIDNLRRGCTIGYTGPQFTYLAPNLHSASQQPEVIDATLRDECEAGRILGPFDQPPLPNFRTSGLGLVPKHDGGWQIIYHLSAPFAQSINDFIDPHVYSLSYCTIDDAYKILNELGPGALMSKIDLKNAFHLIPVRPEDWNLLGICWHNKFFVDTCLPFGLRSAPYLFNQLSIVIHWILQHLYSMAFIIYCTIWMISLQPDLQTHHNAQKIYNQCSHYAATLMPLLNHRKLRALPHP